MQTLTISSGSFSFSGRSFLFPEFRPLGLEDRLIDAINPRGGEMEPGTRFFVLVFTERRNPEFEERDAEEMSAGESVIADRGRRRITIGDVEARVMVRVTTLAIAEH